MRVPRPKHVLFLLAAIAAAAVAAVPQASGGSYSGTNGWIAYSKTTVSGGGMGGPPSLSVAIKGIKTDGTTGSFASSINGVPSWSADGSKIAWIQTTCAGFMCTAELKVAKADGTNAITVLDDADLSAAMVSGYVALNANGTKVAFSGQDGMDRNIWVIDVAAGASFDDGDVVVSGAGMGDAPTHPTFSSSGKIAYLNAPMADCTGYTHVYVLDAPDPGTPTAGRELTETCDNGGLVGGHREMVSGSISWSPDGTKIAYAVDKSTVSDVVYTVAADDASPKQAIYTTADDSTKVLSAMYSPDGTKVAFVESPNMGAGTTSLKYISADGSGSATTLTTENDEDVDISWGPNVSITAGSGSGGGGTPAPSAWTLKKGRTATFRLVATKKKFTYPRGAVLSATSQSKAICIISKGKVKALKVGTCKVTLKAKPKKGAATTKQVSFSVVA